MTFTKKIEEMNLLGNGITKLDGCVVFCLGAIDGDTVTAEITRETIVNRQRPLVLRDSEHPRVPVHKVGRPEALAAGAE